MHFICEHPKMTVGQMVEKKFPQKQRCLSRSSGESSASSEISETIPSFLALEVFAVLF
jgi:hypothetical protein